MRNRSSWISCGAHWSRPASVTPPNRRGHRRSGAWTPRRASNGTSACAAGYVSTIERGPAVIAWRTKLFAFSLHFLATAVLAAIAAALIFLIWFPAPFARMVGGTELFML